MTTGALAELDRSAASRLIRKDPARAISFLTDRATEEALPFHLQEIALQWSSVAPNAAGRWLASLPKGPENDHALMVYAQTVLKDDPESVAYWAETISAEELLEKALEMVLSNWYRIDPKAAAAFDDRKTLR
ncbi:MAG: hypothetical protein AAF514_10315 [Verrucomicrobiota bacterium]